MFTWCKAWRYVQYIWVLHTYSISCCYYGFLGKLMHDIHKRITWARGSGAHPGRCRPASARPAGINPAAESRAGPAHGGSGRRWSRSRCLSAEKPQRIRLHRSRAGSLRAHAKDDQGEIQVLVCFCAVSIKVETHRWWLSSCGVQARGKEWAGSPWWRRWSRSSAGRSRSLERWRPPGRWPARRREAACSARTAARPWSSGDHDASRPAAAEERREKLRLKKSCF